MTERKRISYRKNDGSTGQRKPPGKRNRKRLTESNVLNLPVKARRQYIVWDQGTDAARGLHVLVSPAGAKTYRSTFYFPGSAKPHSRKLGRVGEMSLAEARALCRADRAAARNSEDPRANNPARSDSFKSCVEAYIADEQISNKKNETALEVQRMVLKACQHWHGRPIATIRPLELQSLLRGIRDDGDGINKPRPYLANKVHSQLKSLFKWCANPGVGLLTVSPMTSIARPWNGAKSRERVFSDDELKRLWHCPVDSNASAYLKMLILTGKRRGKSDKRGLASMRWGQINDAWQWTPIAGVKNKRQHPLPLPKLAQRVLIGIKPKHAQPDDLVFAPINWRFSEQVKQLSGIDDFFVHAIRHTVETKLAELKVPEHIRDRLLDHAPSRGAGAGYDHFEYLDEKRAAMEQWADHIEGLVAPQGVKALR